MRQKEYVVVNSEDLFEFIKESSAYSSRVENNDTPPSLSGENLAAALRTLATLVDTEHSAKMGNRHLDLHAENAKSASETAVLAGMASHGNYN